MAATLLTMTKSVEAIGGGGSLLEFLPKKFEHDSSDRCCECGFVSADCGCEQLEFDSGLVTKWHVEITKPTQVGSFLHRDAAVRSMVQSGLVGAGPRLKNVRCTVDATTVCLMGTVHRYFHLQQAIAIAHRFAAGRHIDLRVAVISKPGNPSSANDVG